MATNLRFFWNGIKGTDGKLQKAHYSESALIDHPAGTITIFARDCLNFSEEIQREFTVENDSEMISDYFEDDHIRVTPDHPLYASVNAALDKCRSRYAA